MQPTIGSHGLALVPPQEFSNRMLRHWSGKLNMKTPPALPRVWATVAEHMQRLIVSNASGVTDVPSVVLPLPTGSGKTEGTYVYASMQAELNAGHAGRPVGMLIVTRLIVDADKAAAEINALSGRGVAVALHSESTASPSDIFNADVLVVTHEGYRRAAESFGLGDTSRWAKLSSWRGGERLLVIIDEALGNVVRSYRATAPGLATALRSVPNDIHQKYPNAVEIISNLEKWLEKREDISGEEAAKLLWDAGLTDGTLGEVQSFRAEMQGALCDPALFNENAPSLVDNILHDIEMLLTRHAYYFRNGAQPSINGGAYLIPSGFPGAVVLDATADHDAIYRLLGDRALVAPIPQGIRDYSNVTLHVCRTSAGLGKHVMDEKKQTRLPRLAAHLSEQLGPDRSIFLCVHKHSGALAETFNTDGLRIQIGHWGAVDGKNDWKDCDVAVIWGLPYMDQRRAIDSVFALHGPQDTQWLQANTKKGEPTQINVVMQRHLSASVIQAVNRIACRKVIDELGRCPVSDVYLALPKGWEGQAILNDITTAMPGIKVTEWDYEPDGPKVYAPRSTSANAAILTLMQQRKPGSISLPHIARELSLKPRQMQRLRENLNDAEHNITKALRDHGVIYHVTGKGRGSKSYLLKTA